MTKRILSLLLAAMMVLGSLVVVSAAETDYAAENTWAVEVLSKLEVLQGDENGDPMLDNAILRYEMALFLARALTGKTDDAYWAKVENETPFDDLLTHPYNGAATWNYNHGIILGVTDTLFNPNGNITYQDAIVMVVRAWADYFLTDGLAALGIKDELHYPWKHIELADDLGLTANIDPTEKYLENTTRGVVAQLVYNLLTWYDAATLTKLGNKVNPLHTESIGADKFNLVISAKNGDDFTATEIKDGKVTLDGNPNDLKLAETEFARFELTAKKDAVYTIIYYTIGEETVVTSIKQKSADDAQYVNTPAGKTFDVVYEATAWKDNDKSKDATEWKVTGINVDGTVYSIGEGKDPLTFVVNYAGFTFATKNLNADAVKANEAIVDSLYGTLKLADTNGDGKVETITVTPYVFAAIYAEVDADDKADTKPTTFKFAGYAVVSYADATKANAGSFTWTNACKDANGEYKVDFTATANAEYVAKATATTLATAEKLALVTIDKYDIRANVTNYFEIAGSVYGYKYTALLGWDAAATYYTVANDGTTLAQLYANKGLANDKIPANQYKYVNAYVLDGKLVAIELAQPDGTTAPSTPSTPAAEYAGIIDLATIANATAPKYDADVIKVVNGAYYLKTSATVNGVAVADVLVYLGKATSYEFDITNSDSPAKQQQDWQDAQNKSIKDGYDKLYALAGANAFYTVDANGNYVVVTDVAVTGEAYLTHVGGAALIAPADKTKQNITNLKYTMDRASEDFITYTFSETGKTDATKYVLNIATNETVWLFVTADGQRLEAGVPEYGSEFSVAKYTDIVKNGNTIIVFAAPTKGFNYTMYQDATYAIYNGSTALDMGVRDGYYYYTAKNLFTGKNFIMKVLETSPMVAELKKAATAAAAGAQSEIIIAVTNDAEHELLETYKIEKGTIAAIASLTYGTSSFEDLAKDYTTDALVARIKAQYNLTAVQAMLMDGTINTLVGGTLTMDVPTTIAGDYYVFFTPASGDTAASYVVFICG